MGGIHLFAHEDREGYDLRRLERGRRHVVGHHLVDR